ncbi:MAG: nuclear transport factor 2 family protein [Thermoplasmata archaeon]
MATNVLERTKEALEALDVDVLVSCYAEDFLFEDIPSELRITEKADLKTYYEHLFALPNVKFSDTVIYDGGDWAALEWTWSGNKRDSGAEYQVRGASIIELRDGRIARETIYFDPRPALS